MVADSMSTPAPSSLTATQWVICAVACLEFVAAVAWLAELFPNPSRRESVLGYTQASAAVGGLFVTVSYYLAVTYGEHLPSIRGGHEAWRYALLFGMLPAIPLMVIRPFLPESPVWTA